MLRVGLQGSLVSRQPLGVGGCIRDLATALVRTRDGNELVLYLGDQAAWPELTGGPPVPGVRVGPMPAWTRWRALRILWEQLALPRQAQADRLSLVHATGYVLPVLARLPVVLTVYDLLALSDPALCRPATRWHYGCLLPRSIRRADHLIVPSQAVRQELLSRFPLAEERVSVVLPGIREQLCQAPRPEQLAALQHRYRLPERFVLFVGNLEPKKNLERLIEAFLQARRAGLAGELILAGGAGWGTGLARARPAAGVRWLGYLPVAELAALFRLASELAFPSLTEGFGLPVVEAMACGTVVVASPVPAVTEAGADAVVEIDPRSVEDITRGLLRARQDQGLRDRLVTLGRRRAARFSWQQAALRTWQIYHSVAGR